jgi:cytochrome c oxidase subunit II
MPGRLSELGIRPAQTGAPLNFNCGPVPTSLIAVNAFTNGSPRPLPDGGPPAAEGPFGSEPSRRPRRRGWPRWATVAAIAAPLALTGCNFYPSYGASRGATQQGSDTFKLYSGMMTTGIIVGGAVGLLILWTLIRYRRRTDEMPRQFHENIPIEIIYTVVPVLIVAVLFFFTVITENKVTAEQPINATTTSSGQPVVNIRVTAFQWGWRFDYPKLDVGVAGETTNGPNNHGPQMEVPVGETVQVTLVSDDVIHGFYVHDFNFSRYALPGVTNIFDLDVLHAGTFNGQCTQICGLYHSEMLFSVKAVSPTAFAQWAATETRTGHTLNRSGSSAANNPPPATHITPADASPPPATAKGAA